jgi:competence protein ComEC
MWLGMLTSIIGQVPVLPVEPINWLESLCLAYIAQIARWLASPGWASLTVGLSSIWSVAAAYALLILALELLLRWADRVRRTGLLPSAKAASLAVVAGLAVGLAVLGPFREQAARSSPADLTVRVLDVGQGDSILLQPPDAEPVLVDTGPPGDGVEDRLSELGIDRLDSIVITHDQSDHAGALGALLASVRADRLVYARDDARLRGAALSAGVEPYRLAKGGELDAGGLRLTALWPPRELLHDTDQDPNLLCLVLVARWRHFSMLLTGDAEAEAVPIDPGPVDVLKVAHHGSEDAGLDELLDRSVPKLAVISVGAGNPFGHPDGRTMADLREHDLPALRTDTDGEIDIEANGSRWTVAPDGG